MSTFKVNLSLFRYSLRNVEITVLTHRRLSGERANRPPDARLLALLARYYNEVADLRPCLDLVPLFPFASWSLGKL